MSATIALGDIVKLRKGRKAQEVLSAAAAGALPYIQIDEVRGVAPTKYAKDASAVDVGPDDLCIVWDGANAGTVGYGLSGAIGSTVARIRFSDRGQWDAAFVGRLLQGKFRQLNDQAQARGATIPHVDKSKLEQLAIPRIDLDEQRRIAAILDKADAIRRKREQALALADDFLKSTFLEMFGDPAINPFGFEKKPVRELAEKISDGPFGSNLKSAHYVRTGVRVVRLQNIGVDEFVARDEAFISNEHFNSLKRHECQPGDLLVGTLGDPNLRACIQPDWLEVALNKADCVQLRVDESVATKEFVCVLLNRPSTEALAQGLVLGQTRSRISMGRLRTLEVPIPPLERQKEFSRLYRKQKQSRRTMVKALKASANLFASLSQRAFRGEL